MSRCIRFLPLLLLSMVLAACSSGPSRPSAVYGTDVGDRRSVMEQEYAAALDMMKFGDVQGAMTVFSEMTRIRPGLSGPWTNMGILQARSGDQKKAIQYFRRALEGNQRNVVAMNWLGHLCSQSGDVDGARKWFSKALYVRRDYAPTHLNLAILYDTKLNQSQDAIRHYRQYQQLTNDESLAVSAWIRELENNVEKVSAVDMEDFQ